MNKYSVDGKNLTGCAYGPKIFSYGEEKTNQWLRIIDLFKNHDPFSNRAIIQIFDPYENLNSSNIDVTCTIALQFFIRNEKLYLSSFTRSNDWYRGMVSDVFSFTFIQELLAAELGIDVGSYFHNIGTLNLYKADFNNTIKILEESKNNVCSSS